MKSRRKAIKHQHLDEDMNLSRRICHLLLDLVILRKVSVESIAMRCPALLYKAGNDLTGVPSAVMPGTHTEGVLIL